MICCKPFDTLLTSMGQKGLSSVLKSEMGVSFFCLQARACDAADAKKLEGQITGIPVKIRLVDQTGIRYCPFCGTDLIDWIARHPEQARQLAIRSESFTMK